MTQITYSWAVWHKLPAAEEKSIQKPPSFRGMFMQKQSLTSTAFALFFALFSSLCAQQPALASAEDIQQETAAIKALLSAENAQHEEDGEVRSLQLDPSLPKPVTRAGARIGRLTQTTKSALTESARAAFFETFGGKPVLKFYDPFRYQVTVSEFSKDLFKPNASQDSKKDATKTPRVLKELKRTTLSGSKAKGFVAEEYFEGSTKKAFEKLTRRNADAPAEDGFVTLYKKDVPLLLKLESIEEASAVIAHMRHAFETAGLTAPMYEKPLLVISIDGKTIANTAYAEADETFLLEHFTLANFADEDVKAFFLESQNGSRL